MNIFTSNLNKDSSSNLSQIYTPTQTYPNVLTPKEKEININVTEEKKIKIYKKPSKFDINLQVRGKSIFENLVLTITATANNEFIPIKCKWKWVNGETVIVMKDIVSLSYMPSAEDIGYSIEIEAESWNHPNETAIIQYGPIEINTDMKNVIEESWVSGQSHFNCISFNPNQQEKTGSKEYILHLLNDELKWVEIDFTRKETVLERCRYSKWNPIIKLHCNDPHHFTLTFMEYCCDNSSNNQIDESVGIKCKQKNEYHLRAESKQCRELIYLIIQFFWIDEKLKNNKWFSLVNYNNIPNDTKVGITDWISEVKTLREENTLMMKNMKYWDHVNKKWNEDLKNLEEDFQITWEQINDSGMNIADDLERNYMGVSNIDNTINQGLSNDIGGEWKKKYDELNNIYTRLKAQEQVWREEKKEIVWQSEINKNLLKQQASDMKEMKTRINELQEGIGISNKNNQTLTEQNMQLKKEISVLNQERVELLDQIQQISNSKDRSDEIKNYKTSIETLQKKVNILQNENKNIIIQMNRLTNEKGDMIREFDKLKTENSIITTELSKAWNQIKTIEDSRQEKEKLVKMINQNHEELMKDYSDLQNNYDLLKLDNQTLKENYEKAVEANNYVNMSINGTNVKITPDEYEEFDQLRKDKDESDALIMQLKSNNDAKDLEIQNWRNIITSINKCGKLIDS